jgi:type I restriction enzyme S subunit
MFMEYKRLGDLATYVNGYAFKPADRGETGLPIIRIQDLTGNGYDLGFYNGEYPKKIEINNGDVLISWSASLGVYVWERGKALLNQHIFKVVFDKATVNKDYYVYAVRYNLKVMETKMHGATMKHIVKKDFDNVLVPFPSLKKQEEISETLTRLNNIIEKRKQQLQQLDELVKARFVELMNSNSSHNFLSDFIVSYKAERCGDRDLPVLSITKDDGIVLQNEKFKKRIASVDASTYKIVPKGKLVQGIHIDERNFAIQNIVDEGIVSPAYKIWTVDTTKAIPEVLAFALRTDRTMAYISSKFTGSIKRRESISISDFMATPIDLPNIFVQNEFANFVKEVDKSKFVVQKALDEAQTLLDSLMQEYFG